jgi:hypothetical protein
MKRLAAVALIAVGVLLPACAQRGGSHGGFSGHSAQGFHGGISGGYHGGFSAPGSNRTAGAPRYAGSRSPRAAYGFQRGAPGNSGARPTYPGARRHRRPYTSPYRTGIGYGVPVWPGWIGPNYLGDGDAYGYDDSQSSPDSGGGGYAAPPEDQGPPPYPATYSGPTQPSPEQPSPSSATDSAEAVTLVYKDGRPPEQIHNYILTATTLYVGDQHRRDIPVDQLDLAATEKVNRDAGVDFHLPALPGS